jgi:hypothetical protein
MRKTQEKLNEAKFFLDHLEDCYNKPPEFDYFLNAFVSSSRSVLWIMRNEYGKINSWKEWYENQRPTKKEEKFLQKISELRNRSLKKGPIKTMHQLGFFVKNTSPQFEKKCKELEGQRVKLTISSKEEHQLEVTDNSITCTGKLTDFFPYVKEFPDDDILSICKKYYSMLESLATRCEKKFN